MLKALTVFGTRPEAIKMAPVVKEFQKFPDRVQAVVCVTGQHRTMLDQVLQIFGIVPDFDLDLMTENQSLSVLTAQALEGVCRVIAQVKPDVVLVQGDTTTAMASALAAFYQKIPLGHIEAGLRTYDPYTPFPEEMNRRLISTLTTFHFAPTETAAKALRAEGVPPARIFLTGNTVVDALQATSRWHGSCQLPRIPGSRKLILVTAHRRESFGDPIEEICSALKKLVQRNSDVEILYPVHLNPNIHEPVYRILGSEERIHLTPPLPYADFVLAMNRAYLILTDSGGIQEEAPALGKPVLVLRQQTERPEAVEAGAVKIVGTDRDRIISESELLLRDAAEYERRSRKVSPYGDGHAAERIVGILLERLVES
jgi:UDP-N-acetylglucosamine 2-epimerase